MADTPVNAADRLRLYETMAAIKANDERFRSMISSGQLFLIYYPPRGQEAIAAGVGAALRPDDYVVTTYRGLHDQIAKGVPLRELWAEYLGRVTGTCKGKGGPMHVTHPASGLMVTTGIVGSGMPIANGLALGSVLADDGRVTVVNFGDGASNIGAFHESLNLASLWKLPVIFVCQNNFYGEHTGHADAAAETDIAAKASAAYAMPGVAVDGNDPEAVFVAAGEAVRRARAGEGPTLIEARAYRFWGHVFGDDMAYQPPAERQAAMDADPVPAYRARLLAEQVADEEALADIEARIATEIEDAVAFALASPEADLSEIDIDVFAEAVTA